MKESKFMKKMLFMGDSNETYEFLKYAQKKGFYTIVTDYFEPQHSTAKLLANAYWMISTGELDQLEQKCKEENIWAVISGSSDFNIEMSIRLCKRIGLPCFCTENVWIASKDKELFKRLCREAGAPTPDDFEISSILNIQEVSKVKFPVVVKPVDMCANAGVSFCFNKEELIRAYRYAESLSNKDKIIVERMLHGIEFCSYYILAEGEAAFLTLCVRIPQSGQPSFCYSMNTTINNFTEQYLEEMDSPVKEVLKRIGCGEGVACVQCIWDNDGHFYAFEMCYCPETSLLIAPLRHVCPFDTIQWQFECAIGKKHLKSQLPSDLWRDFQGHANSYILFSRTDGVISEIKGLEAFDSFSNVELRVRVHVGDCIQKYYPLGNILFYTDSYEQTCKIIEQINENIQIKNTLGENVIIYFNNMESLNSLHNKNIN